MFTVTNTALSLVRSVTNTGLSLVRPGHVIRFIEEADAALQLTVCDRGGGGEPRGWGQGGHNALLDIQVCCEVGGGATGKLVCEGRIAGTTDTTGQSGHKPARRDGHHCSLVITFILYFIPHIHTVLYTTHTGWFKKNLLDSLILYNNVFVLQTELWILPFK